MKNVYFIINAKYTYVLIQFILADSEQPSPNELVAHQNYLFETRQKQQWSERAPRIEKIKVLA